jgi:predicted AlkP superfamily phosphohydrolase/phosphomutase
VPAPVVLVGFDAADIGRIEQLIDAGCMPNLAALRKAGQYGPLRARLHHFEDMTWSRWMESLDVSRRYFPKIWQPDSMTFALASECWQPRTPFWAHVARAGGRIAVFDVPHSPLPSNGDAALMVKGWQAATFGTRASAPADLWSEIVQRFGAPVVAPR